MAHRRAPQADSDLDDIWHYVATLAKHPHLGRSRDHDLRPGLRSFPVGHYVILYAVEGTDILILRVLRGSRQIEAMFGD